MAEPPQQTETEDAERAAFSLRSRSGLLSVGFTTLVAAALIVGLYSKRDAFGQSLGSAPIWTLGLAVILQIAWLLARSEAWHVCVEAAGGRVGRRRLYGAASVGYLGNLLNSQLGLAVRIAALRRAAPDDAPRAGVLVAAEMPIVVIEIGLAAITSFTLIGPLGVPWWAPLIAVGCGVAAFAAISRLAHLKRDGLWRGLAVMRGLKGRSRIVGLTIFAVLAQVVRNWLVLHGIGVDVSFFDATALLIAAAAIGLLPVGPSLGVATAVLILGAHGVAAVAAAGALLTATGAVGALCFAAIGFADRLRGAMAPAIP